MQEKGLVHATSVVGVRLSLVLHNHVRLVTMCGATTNVRFAIRIDEERLLRECAARAIEVLRLEPWHSSCVALIDGAPRVG